MRHLMTSNASAATPALAPTPDAKLFAELNAFIEELSAAGVLPAAGGPTPSGVRLVSEGGYVSVTDGPFAESKEKE